MIYSEDNYGRFEAMAALLGWVGVGWVGTILILDGVHLSGHGIASLLHVIRPVILAGVLLWLVPSAFCWARDVSEIVRYDHSPIPKLLMIGVVFLSLAFGVVSIFAYQMYLLAYFQALGLPWVAVAAHVGSMAVIVSLAIAYAAGIAWFAIFPRKSDWDA